LWHRDRRLSHLGYHDIADLSKPGCVPGCRHGVAVRFIDRVTHATAESWQFHACDSGYAGPSDTSIGQKVTQKPVMAIRRRWVNLALIAATGDFSPQ
jgi:hypothetical protein